jgi:hypothetical protein
MRNAGREISCWTNKTVSAWDPLVNTNSAIRQPDGHRSEIAGGTFAREANATKMDVQAAMDVAPPKKVPMHRDSPALSPWRHGRLPKPRLFIQKFIRNSQFGATDFHISQSVGRPPERGNALRVSALEPAVALTAETQERQTQGSSLTF